MSITVYDRTATRSVRRRSSRQLARRQAEAYFNFVGLTPRYEPARDLSCHVHHRQLPCKRCAEVAS